MRRVFASVLLPFALVACHRDTPNANPHPTSVAPPTASSTSAVGDPRLSGLAANELNLAFDRIGLVSQRTGNTVRAAGHVITAQVQIAQVIEEEVTTAALDIALDLDGHAQEAFHVTSIAHDRNREDALLHAIREWAVGYAIPTVNALRSTRAGLDGVDGGANVAFHLGPYNVFAGPVGARGEVPPDWDARTIGIHAALLARIEPGLRELLPEATSQIEPFHSLRFTIHVRNGVVGEGDCRVDNMPNDRFCELIRTYPWPHAPEETDGYIVKQYYVLANVRR